MNTNLCETLAVKGFVSNKYLHDFKGNGVIQTRNREFVTAKIDWLQIVFHGYEIEEILTTALQIDLACFLIESGRVKHKPYDICYTYGSIKIFTEETSKTGSLECYLVLSGEGCTVYERLLEAMKQTWRDFFQRLFRYFDGFFQVKRLDVALDDRNEQPYFTVKQLIDKAEKNQFYSSNRKYDVYQSTTIGNRKSFTLYIGKRKSDLMFRIYDKDLETAKQQNCAVEEIGSWKRLEIELKRQVAHAMAKVIAFDDRCLEKLIRGVVKDELTFYTDETWKKVWRPWERYLGNIQPLHLSRIYEVTGLTNTQEWLIHGGGLAGMKAFRFLEEHDALENLVALDDLIETTEYTRSLAKKMADHLIDIGREDLIEMVYEQTKKENLEKSSTRPLL